MPEPVVIQIEALDEASAAFEDVEAAGQEAAASIEGSWREADAAGQDYQGTLQEVESQGVGLAATLEDNWQAITAATAGAGLALEGALRHTQDTDVAVRRLAASTEMGQDEIRGLASELSDATFPFEEVVGLMERGREQGIRSQEQLGEFAEFWDMVGDATGENAEQLADASVALRSMGIEATESEEALGAFGFITRETTQGVGDFLSFIERTGPELQNMGISIDETAALIGIMEQELGLTARQARQEFNQALSESDGTLQGLLQQLGVGEETFNRYTQEVEDSNDVIRDNADAYSESITPLQTLQAHFNDLMHSMRPVMQAFEFMSPLLISIGPTIKAVSAAKAALAGTTITLSGAIAGLTAVLTPLAAVLIAAAVIWGLVEAWRAWGDTIKEVAAIISDHMLGQLSAMAARVYETIGAARETIQEVWQGIVSFLQGISLREIGANIIMSLVQGIRDRVRAAVNAARDAASAIVRAAKRAVGMRSPAAAFVEIGAGMGEGVAEGIEDMENRLIEAGRIAGQTPARAAEEGAQAEGGGRSAGQTGGNSQSYNITQDIDIHSPEPMDEREVRKQNEKMLKKAAIEYQIGA